MKRTMLSLVAASALAAAIVPSAADAAPWMSINQRQANLEQRIDQGVRNGSITRSEAISLRSQFRQLVVLENNYRRTRPGLTYSERVDLDRRFDVLSARIQVARNDRDPGPGGGWVSIDQRQANLDRRIDRGIRDGSLNRAEAIRLRAEFRDLARLEARYRTGGLTVAERSDLDRRFDRLSAEIRGERNDRDYGYGYRP